MWEKHWASWAEPLFFLTQILPSLQGPLHPCLLQEASLIALGLTELFFSELWLSILPQSNNQEFGPTVCPPSTGL